MPGTIDSIAAMALRSGAALALAALGIGAVAQPAAAQQRVGVSGAVNPAATGTPPGGAARQLVIGQDVLFKERIATTAGGQTQILFLDESSMTVGPNSDLVIDQFLYDPNTGTGKLAMNATRGVMRFIGGKLSKQDNAVTVTTGTATIGIRGGAFLLSQVPGGKLDVIFIYGKGLTITGAGGVTQTITRPGFAVSVAGPGAPPSPPAPAPSGALTTTLSQLDGRAGSSGGATTVPTDTTVANSGVSTTISGNLATNIQASIQNQPPTGQPPSVNVASTQTNLNVNTVASQSQPAVTSSDLQATGGQSAFSGPSATTSSTPVVVTYAGHFKSTNGRGGATGFSDQSAAGDAAFSGGTLSFPAGSPQNGVFTASLGGAGQLRIPLVPGTSTFGPTGTASPLGPVSGSSFMTSDGNYFYANLIPVNSPNEREFVQGGQPVASTALAPTGATRLSAYTVQPDAALQSNIPFIRNNAGGNLANPSVSPLYVVAPPATAIGDATTASAARILQASVAINGQGANQQSAIEMTTGTVDAFQNGAPVIGGVLRGSSQLSATGQPVRVGSAVSSIVDGNGNSFYGGTSAITGFGLDQTSYNSTAVGSGVLTTPVANSFAVEQPLSGAATNYGFAQPVTATTLPAGIGASRTTQTQTGWFGGIMNTTAQSQPYAITGQTQVSTDAGTNRVAGTFTSGALSPSATGGVSSVTMQFGGLSGNAGGRQAFVDDNTFGAAESQTNAQQINGQNLVVNGDPTQAGKLYMFTAGTAPPPTSLLPAGASYCTCNYLQWGYWGGDLITGNSNNSTVSRVDRGNINFWVAGQPTPNTDLQNAVMQNATATYTGHLIGSVFNNGAQYVAAGGLQGTYNFGSQNASFAVSNYDGRSFTLAGRAPLSGANYTFTANNVPGLTGSLNGTFYGPNAANTGGSFNFATTVGPTYFTSGIYAAHR
ncbi:MAG: FecR domain-containing protein [Alphaproteobacteria bacterium]|nr:FecR domain-containing protein [Alphaproteobacteria bacterium]